MFSSIDTKVIYTTGILLADILGGQAFCGMPIHECWGLPSSEYVQKVEGALAIIGSSYLMLKYHNHPGLSE